MQKRKRQYLNMRADRRYMILDGYIAPNSGGKSVASVVENRLIRFSGLLDCGAGLERSPENLVQLPPPLRMVIELVEIWSGR